MKKLTKKHLDELAKTMPVIKEIEMKTIVGGTHYYDLSGNYLSKVGNSDDVKFIAPASLTTGDYSDAKSFSQLGTGSQVSFLRKEFGYNNVNIVPGANAEVGLGRNGTLIADPYSSIWNNLNDIRSTMNHERDHYENGHYLLTGNALHEAEIGTYMRQINTSAYQSTTREYKQKAAEGLWEHISGAGLGNTYSEEQIMQMCGL